MTNRKKTQACIYFCLPYKTIIGTIENAKVPAAGTQINRQYQPLSSTQSLGYVCAEVGESSAVLKMPGRVTGLSPVSPKVREDETTGTRRTDTLMTLEYIPCVILYYILAVSYAD